MGVKAYGWDAKPRTMLRFIKPGDVFMLKLDSGKFGIGRIVSDVSLGNVAEFFDIELQNPSFASIDIDALPRRGRVVVLDSYSLFDKKLAGDWRIVAHQKDFIPKNLEHVFFTYGAGPTRKRVDVFDHEEEVPESVAAKLPPFTPLRDAQIKHEFFLALESAEH